MVPTILDKPAPKTMPITNTPPLQLDRPLAHLRSQTASILSKISNSNVTLLHAMIAEFKSLTQTIDKIIATKGTHACAVEMANFKAQLILLHQNLYPLGGKYVSDTERNLAMTISQDLRQIQKDFDILEQPLKEAIYHGN